MSSITKVLRCHRCGNVLQTANKKEVGFVSRAIIEAGTKIPYCNSCYNQIMELENSMFKQDIDRDILKILKDAVACDATIIWVVDTFTFNGVLNEEIVKKIKKLNLVVVGTKSDLFPKGSDESLKQYLANVFTKAGLTPVSVVLAKNNATNENYLSIVDEINAIRQGHDVYMLGNALSGKSTLINRLLKVFTNNSKRSITTIKYKGTESNVLEVPLSNSAFFYELPGLSINTSILSKVEKDLIQFITPKKTIKQDKKRISPEESIMVGNIVSLSLLKGPSTWFTLYSGEGVETKKIKTNTLSQAIAENTKRKTVRPASDRIVNFLDYDLYDFDIDNDNLSHDIGIKGLGWFKFIGKGQKIRVAVPRGTAINDTVSKVK